MIIVILPNSLKKSQEKHQVLIKRIMIMKKFKDIKIRNQIRLVVIVVILILISSSSCVLYVVGKIVKDKTKTYYEANTTIVAANINSILNSIKVNNTNYSYLLKMSKPLTSSTLYKNQLESYLMDAYIQFNSLFDKPMEGIILYPVNGEEIITAGNADLLNKIFHKIKEQYDFQNNIYQEPFFTESIFEEKTNNYYFACVNPIYEMDATKIKGYFISIINYDFVNDIYIINKEKELNSTILLAEKNNIITSNVDVSKYAAEKIMNYKNKDTTKDKYINFKNTDHVYIDKNIENTNWKIITLIPKEEIQKDTSFLRPIFAFIRITSLIILVVFSRMIISAIIKPMEQIIKKVDKYEPSEKYNDIETSFKNEISEIAMHINEMMHKVKNSNKELLVAQKSLFELEIAKVQAELSYYQSQINPHFLYNTLECIRSLSTFYNAPEIEKLSLSMSKIFRYAVKEETIVTLEDELNCVYEYVNVMLLRFPEEYDYLVDIDEDIKEIALTKMTLQPIIENCFKYGITNQKKTAKIYVRNKITPNYVDIEIIDTGKGIAKEKIKEINEYILKDDDKNLTDINTTRLGLKNINKRIKLCFGNEYGLYIKGEEGFFTKVTVRIPVQK